MTFADLIQCVELDPTLPATRRRDARSAIVTFCRCLNLAPGDAPASMTYVARRVEGVHPRQIGVSTKRWLNVLSELRSALARYASKPIEHIRSSDIPEPWRGLWNALPAPGLKYGLSRFIKFCVLNGIAPGQVDADTFTKQFETWLRSNTTTPDPMRVARDRARDWNQAVRIVSGWPDRPVQLAPARDAYCLSWHEISAQFRAEAERWLACLGEDDWTNEDAPPRPLRRVSIEARRFQLRQAYSVLVRSGCSPRQITSLADIVEPARAETILTFFWQRSGGKPNAQAAGVAACLTNIARHRVKLRDADLRKLQRMKRRVTPIQCGLTDKNRAMLRQFEDDRNKERLLMFPLDTMRAAKGLSNQRPVDAALIAQTALMVELLLMMPMRLRNLASLQLERNIEWRGTRLFILIPSDDVKNAEAIEFELLGPSVVLYKTYVEQFRSTLAKGSGYLFPGTSLGRSKNPTHVSRQITKRLFKASGLRVTAHQFRHIAAKIWLDENPGSYEVVRRILHHRSIDTTTANYTGFETRSATLAYDEFLQRQRRRFLDVGERSDG